MRTEQFDVNEVIGVILVILYLLNTSQSSFVILSLSHISIELLGTDMRDCPEQTSAHTCTHMHEHTKADIHAQAGPLGAQT